MNLNINKNHFRLFYFHTFTTNTFDHFRIFSTFFPDHFQAIGRQLVYPPPIFRAISAPSPHLFRYMYAENLRRRCGDGAEMVRKTS